MIPTTDQIAELHRRYAVNDTVYDLVYTHCSIVSEVALWCVDQLPEAEQATVDHELLAAGCLLHDIGTYALFDKEGQVSNSHNYKQHAIFGAALIQEEGYDDRITAMVRTHVLMGLTAQEITDHAMALPARDAEPQTIEARLLCYADRFHSKHPTFTSYETLLAGFSEQLPEQARKFEAAAKEFGIPDVAALAQKYNHQIR